MKVIEEDKAYQIESLINECKGNIFEFLVTQKLARHFKSEDKFLLALPKDFRHRFSFYEEVIRKFDQNLINQLNVMSTKATEELLNYHILKRPGEFEFQVIGKLVATNDNQLWNETDVVIKNKYDGVETDYYLSLKLTKDHSYTNTKSAGIKSFLEKYFNEYKKLSFDLQQSLNKEVDESFLMMGHRMYEFLGEEFQGQFDSRWSSQYSELPGELPDDLREIVLNNYHRVAKKLRASLEELHQAGPSIFYQSLFSLCGYGSKEIIQVQCSHVLGELRAVEIKSFTDLFSGDHNEIKINQLSANGSSFDIEFEKFNLQIRIKPMNKFTTAAYKVNCSIKLKSRER